MRRLLERRVVFLLIDQARIVKDDHVERVAIAPKMLVVGFDSLADVAQAVGRDHENRVFVGHRRGLCL